MEHEQNISVLLFEKLNFDFISYLHLEDKDIISIFN